MYVHIIGAKDEKSIVSTCYISFCLRYQRRSYKSHVQVAIAQTQAAIPTVASTVAPKPTDTPLPTIAPTNTPAPTLTLEPTKEPTITTTPEVEKTVDATLASIERIRSKLVLVT
jgi:hypothetical protein